MNTWHKIKRYYPPFLDIVAFGMLIFVIVYLVVMYGQLPDQIPRHYNLAGEPDAWSGKILLVGLLIVFVHLSIFIWLLNYFMCISPKDWQGVVHLINLPVKNKDDLNRDQIEKLRKNTARMMAGIHVTMNILFAYIIFGTIQTALGRQNGLGWISTVLVILLIAICIYYSWQSIRVTSKKRAKRR